MFFQDSRAQDFCVHANTTQFIKPVNLTPIHIRTQLPRFRLCLVCGHSYDLVTGLEMRKTADYGWLLGNKLYVTLDELIAAFPGVPGRDFPSDTTSET